MSNKDEKEKDDDVVGNQNKNLKTWLEKKGLLATKTNNSGVENENFV